MAIPVAARFHSTCLSAALCVLLFAAAGATIVSRLHAEVVKAVQAPDIR